MSWRPFQWFLEATRCKLDHKTAEVLKLTAVTTRKIINSLLIN